MGKALVLAAIILNVLTNASSAETLFANDVVYDTEAKDEPATLSCKIYLVIAHSPEVVAFRSLFLFQKNPPTPIVGFNMDLIGVFGQGGSSAFSIAKYSIVVSRRAADIRKEPKRPMQPNVNTTPTES